MRQRLGRIGVWAVQFRFSDPGFIAEAAAEVEELGYGTIWFPGGRGGDLNGAFLAILNATQRIFAASGILNIWMHEPEDVGIWWHAYTDAQRDRVMIGLGVGHADAIGEAWRKPLTKMEAYLDGLDAAGVPGESRCIAALAPKMLELAAERSAGSHPYLVPPEHTAIARETMGRDAFLAPEQGVILDGDPASARSKARKQLDTYVGRANYCNNWKRLGFTDEDIVTKSNRFVDAIFAWGSPKQIGERLKAHLDAGADHVCLQVISGGPGSDDPTKLRQSWRELAPIVVDL
jgi:probable F420-dependent oxidoreductase